VKVDYGRFQENLSNGTTKSGATHEE